MTDFEIVDYWIEQLQEDLKCYDTKEKQEIVRTLFYKLIEIGQFLYYELEDKKGIIAYCFNFDFLGNQTIDELFMYIKPKYRGSFKLFKELVNHVEEVAKDKNCASVRIGANLKYKDQKILNTLKLLGYETDVVVKHI